jgi:hypothetical protein
LERLELPDFGLTFNREELVPDFLVIFARLDGGVECPVGSATTSEAPILRLATQATDTGVIGRIDLSTFKLIPPRDAVVFIGAVPFLVVLCLSAFDPLLAFELH